MTFEARDLSIEDGAPILLAVFALGGKTWRFARVDEPLELAGQTYLPMAMSESNIRSSTELVRNAIKLTVPWDHPIAELWRRSPPVGTIGVILKELHRGDTETSNAWQGHVAGVTGTYRASAEIQLAPGIVALKNTGLRRPWQINCPHVLYHPSTCRVDPEDWKGEGTIATKVGLDVTAAVFGDYPTGTLAAGFFRWTDSEGVTDWRYITSHSGNTVRMSMSAPHLEVDQEIQVFPGCNRTTSRCIEFNNLPNYGGIPYFARQNPFDGSPIF